MVAYPKTKPDSFFYTSRLHTDEIEEVPAAGARENGGPEEIVLGAALVPETVVTDPESLDAYPTPDESAEADEDAFSEPDSGVNVASLYLKEMNRIPLLTRKREIEVARKIQEGERKVRSLILKLPIQAEEIQELRGKSRRQKTEIDSSEELVPKIIRRIEATTQTRGKESRRISDLLEELRETEAALKSAKAEMIQSNLRLVVSIAKIYLNRGLSFLDLIQEGNMGLMKAVTRYDYRRGFKFSTYASWWIRQAITRALADKSRTVRIPNHLLETRSKMTKAFHQLVKDLGRDPMPEEVAEKANLPLASVLKVGALIQEPVSFETPVGEDGSKLQDLVGGEESLTFQDDFLKNLDLAKKVRDLLSTLSSREEQIVRLRFGIGFPSGYTLEEIGKRFGISRERVRQIEERALRKLKLVPPPRPESQESEQPTKDTTSSTR